MNNYCIYRHIRLDTNQVFYIGIGKNIKRAYNTFSRNKFWKNIVNKTKYEIQILKSNMTLDEANELEIMLINYYGRRDLNKGNLVNLTDGGSGVKNNIITQETRDKISKANKGRVVPKYCLENLSKLFSYKIINVETKEIYNNINNLEGLTKYCIGTLRLKLTRKLNNNTPFLYLKDYNNLINIKNYTNIEVKYNNRRVLNIKTNTIYNSIIEASKFENIKKTTLQSKLSGYRKNNTNLIYYNE